MKLIKFRVKDFRAVEDTGWIECQNITAFAGENESGKTTLLIALLKLAYNEKQADTMKVLRGGKVNRAMINVASDFPIARRDTDPDVIANTTFVYAEFELTDEMKRYLEDVPNIIKGKDSVVVSRKYNGRYGVDILHKCKGKALQDAQKYILSKMPKFVYYREIFEVSSTIDFISLAVKLNKPVKTRNLSAKETMVSNLLDALDIWESNFIKALAEASEEIAQKNLEEIDFRVVFERIPSFRDRVERGFEKFNKEFTKWWGKSDIKIIFEPYERGIIIKVKDGSGKTFSLENRSTGFRRFFSMFLSFSAVHRTEYENSILLFDEAGAALHPLTQRMLAEFFNALGEKTQILFNTHNSRMLSVSHMNRVRVVYRDINGHVQVSESLRVNADRTNEMSLFPVQSALASYVAEKAMAGCWPIVVLNESDENYLSLTKNMLVAKGLFRSVYNVLIFATGENGIDAACKLFSEDEDYPMVLLPSGPVGKAIKNRLVTGIYKNCPKKVMELADFSSMTRFENLIPSTFVEMFSRSYLTSILGQGVMPYLARILGQGFVYNKKQDFIEQIEEYARTKNIELPVKYRSEISKRIKLSTMSQYKNIIIPSKYISTWKGIWTALLKKYEDDSKKTKEKK